MKDNLIDEERAKQEEAAQESLDQKLERLGKITQQCCILVMLLMNFDTYSKKNLPTSETFFGTRVHKSFMGVT